MTNQIQDLKTSKIRPGNNDRTVFNPDALQKLANSIKTHGLAQPITVQPMTDGTFQIVAGERRFRAMSQILEMSTIPAIVRDLDDEQAAAIMLTENVSRTDLDPIDEARAYQSRMDTFGWTVKDCAEKAGVSTVRVLFRVKLLKLREDIQKLVKGKNVPLGYAQILADGDLDRNRQLLALRDLRDNASPTPAWFRKVVGRLVNEQAQDSLFDTDAFFVAQEIEQPESRKSELPALPSTTTPPTIGDNAIEILANQAEFWIKAANGWEELGRSFKRQECEAAAQALLFALKSIGKVQR